MSSIFTGNILPQCKNTIFFPKRDRLGRGEHYFYDKLTVFRRCGCHANCIADNRDNLWQQFPLSCVEREWPGIIRELTRIVVFFLWFRSIFDNYSLISYFLWCSSVSHLRSSFCLGCLCCLSCLCCPCCLGCRFPQSTRRARSFHVSVICKSKASRMNHFIRPAR